MSVASSRMEGGKDFTIINFTIRPAERRRGPHSSCKYRLRTRVFVLARAILRRHMGSLLPFFVSWWGLALKAVAIVHFIRRRPDTYWLFIILIGGWLGPLAYILVEVIPDAGLLRTSFQVFPRRRRIRELERTVLDNPSAGNYEELGLLYLDDGDFSRARACYDQAISSRADHADPFYRRGIAELALHDVAAAA